MKIFIKNYFIIVCFCIINCTIAQENQLKFRFNSPKEKINAKTKGSQIGKPLFESHYEKNGTDTNWIFSTNKLNTYNQNGQKESVVMTDQGGNNQSKIIYFYNKFGSDTCKITQVYDADSSQWKNATKQVSKRDNHNNLTEKSFFYWNGTDWVYLETEMQTTYFYNANGFITEKIAKRRNQYNLLVNDYKLTHIYNGKNLMLETMYKYDEDISNWVPDLQWICSYDSQNALTGFVEQQYVNGIWRNHEKNHNLTFLQNNPIDWGQDNDDYFVYYANKVTKFDISYWDTITNNWVLDNRSNVTWDNFNGHTSLCQVYRNNIWVNDYLSYEGYDQFNNYLGYYEKSWQDTSWVWEYAYLNTYTYDSGNNVTQKINYEFENQDSTYTESYKKEIYSDFQFFYCNAKYTCNSNTTTVTFSNLSDGLGIASYWKFGDGEISRTKNPVHTYPNTGFYRVSLSIYNPNIDCYDTKDSIIAVGNPFNDCQALFTYVDNGSLSATFTNLSLGLGINNYLWNFGDGQTSNVPSPTHLYANGGFYDVCLTISTSNGCVNTYCRQIAIDNGGNDFLPYFSYAIDSTISKGKQAVSYKGAAFGDPAKDDYSIDWNFGDGATASSSFIAQHTYDNEGVYLVSLKLTGTNKTRFCVDLINLSPSQSTLKGGFGFLLDTNSKANSYPVSYKGAAFGDPARILWNFGDGSTDTTTMSPLHIYADTGMYNVCLTLSDPITGKSDMNCQQVRVGSLVNVKNFLLNSDESVKIYPNPANDLLNIYFYNYLHGKVTIELFDNIGNNKGKILERTYNKGNIEYSTNISNLRAGIYYLMVKTTSSNKVVKFVKF